MSNFVVHPAKDDLPLVGVKVVDFGQPFAGAAVAMVLADLGATVIHIEPPSQHKHAGRFNDSPLSATLNRNKNTVVLDLKKPSGVQCAVDMIIKADCVIDSFRPGVLRRLGIDYYQLRKEKPELITLSIPGFPSNDPIRSNWKATEAVILATAGAFTDMGFNRVLMGFNPCFSPLVLGSAYTTAMATASIVLALYSRLHTGLGDCIEVPIVAATIEGLSYNSIVVEGYPERYKCMREKEIEKRRANKTPFDVPYENLKTFLDPFYRTYSCKDGRLFYLVAPSHPAHVSRAMKALGVYEKVVNDLGFPVVSAPDQHAPSSILPTPLGMLGQYPICKEWADQIAPIMEEAFATKTAAEWTRIFGESAIPATPHRTTQEWVQCAHNRAAGIMVDVAADPQYGDMTQIGPLVWLEESAGHMLTPRARRSVSISEAMALLDEAAPHSITSTTTAIAAALSATETTTTTATASATAGTTAATSRTRHWLQGVRIIDLCNVIAGPHASAFLSRFGAEVIKLEPVTPSYEPLVASAFTYLTDLGKKKVLLDITTDLGREAFHRLLKTADVIVINAVERQLAPLGLHPTALQSINPNLIFCRLTAFCGPNSPVDERCGYVGYDDVVQSFSGIMSRFGGKDTPEEHAHLGTLDVNCGFSAALSIAVALFHRRRTGRPSHPQTSLSACASLVQSPFAYDFEGRGAFDEPSGRQAMGYDALSHFYQCKDEKWVYIDSCEEELGKLDLIFPGIANVAPSSRADILRSAFKDQPAEALLTALRAQDVAAASPLCIAEDIRSAHTRKADGVAGCHLGSFAFTHYPKHPGGRPVTHADCYAVRPTEAGIIAPKPAEVHGASTKQVLRSLDFTEEQIQNMLDKKLAADSWGPFMPN